MRYLSLFSGIESASVAWAPLGWTCVGFSEIEPFPCALLAHRYPDVPNLGDVSKITRRQIDALGPIDVVVGGFPCQDLSVAGKRAGMGEGSATRSALFWDALRIADWSGARYVVIENVPGLFSSADGRDFAAVAGALAGCEFDVPPDGWANAGAAAGPNGCVEWRTLDAQYVRVESHPRAVPQRRRRVFIVRHSGDWARSAPVLLVAESLLGHPAPRREAREGTARSTAPSLTGSGRGVERAGETRGQDPVIAVPSYSLCHPLAASAHVPAIAFSCKDSGNDAGNDISPTLRSMNGLDGNANGGGQVAIAFDARQSDVLQYGEKSGPLDTDGSSMAVAFDCFNQSIDGDITHTLRVSTDNGYQSTPHVMSTMQVRRLLPVECEKLQGFPPGWTDIPYKGKRAADGPRYRALGNSFAVNCIRWVGERIAAHEGAA